VARKVKEQFSYICPDLAKEYARYDSNPAKHFKVSSRGIIGHKAHGCPPSLPHGWLALRGDCLGQDAGSKRLLSCSIPRQTFSGRTRSTGRDWTADVGYERFLGPEIFFNPEIFSSDFTTPLPDVVDECILKVRGGA
jgi:actin-related protein 3